MRTVGIWSHDPGPCPVDDTPHTACTPESVARLRVPLVSTPAHARAAQLVAERVPAAVAPEPEPEPPPPVPFTTQTYRRATHGRKRGPRAGD